MKILSLDTETNGLNTQTCAVVEIGVVQWDLEANRPIILHSVIVDDRLAPTYGQWEVSERVSGIGQQIIDDWSMEDRLVVAEIKTLIEDSDYVLAANGNRYDKPVLQAFFNRYTTEFPKTPWIDLYDFPFPPECKSRELFYLAAFHGFINPFAHRALTDAFTALKVVLCYDVYEVIERYKTLTITLIAKVDFEQKDLAKNAGFMWQKGKKKWMLVIKEQDLVENPVGTPPKFDTNLLPFDVDVVEGDQRDHE